MFEKNEILKELNENICTATFTKVSGETRVMNCTLRKDIVPVYERKTDRVKAVTTDDVVSVYDINASGFRSFKLSNLIKFEIKK